MSKRDFIPIRWSCACGRSPCGEPWASMTAAERMEKRESLRQWLTETVTVQPLHEWLVGNWEPENE